MSGEQCFEFLGEVGDLRKLGWDSAAKEKLWRYNLHYFDDLNAKGAHSRREWHLALFRDWIEKNRPGQGTGWEPYPTSLRIVNWIKWLLAGNEFPAAATQSLATQARWLLKRLEWHLLGNHLFANAKALVYAGLAFEGDEAEAWLEKGLRIIERELPEQVLADGGNFERSPMYHAIFLNDILDLVNIANVYPQRINLDAVDSWKITASKMLAWLAGMCHPDGEVSFFNDSAPGIAPTLKDLVAYGKRLGTLPTAFPNDNSSSISVNQFPDSGYIRVSAPDAVTIIDVAPVGPDYLPGHGHADTLSFELSLFGQRTIVNGGTSRYGISSERLRERGTSAHSTVVIDGKNSSEVWGGFRVARRAYPFDLNVDMTEARASVSCSHDGYRRLRGHPIHRREWSFTANSLLISDSVSGTYRTAKARYLLHPGVDIAEAKDNNFQLRLPQGQSLEFNTYECNAHLEPALYATEFGKVTASSCIVVEIEAGTARAELKWI